MHVRTAEVLLNGLQAGVVVFTGVVFPLEEAVLAAEFGRKSYFDGVHPGRPGTDRVPTGRRGGARRCDQRQDVPVETLGRRVALGGRVKFDRADAELEVSGVRGGQLDEDGDDAAGPVAANYDVARPVATSQLVVARRRFVPRVATHAAFAAVHRPLRLPYERHVTTVVVRS